MDVVSDRIVKNKKSKKRIQRITFDQEIVTKENAVKFMNTPNPVPNENGNNNYVIQNQQSKQSRKRTRDNTNEIEVDSNNVNSDNATEESSKLRNIKKKNKKKTSNSIDGEVIPSKEGIETIDKKHEESIRAQKRKKYAKLLEEKKLKSELTMQQNGLNYLSKWKHSRDQWKFEKLKQIWLQQNMFDCSKIPEQFWDTTAEYFCGAKGAIRNVILKEALKIIETEENSTDKDSDEEHQAKLQRARSIVQNLQE